MLIEASGIIARKLVVGYDGNHEKSDFGKDWESVNLINNRVNETRRIETKRYTEPSTSRHPAPRSYFRLLTSGLTSLIHPSTEPSLVHPTH